MTLKSLIGLFLCLYLRHESVAQAEKRIIEPIVRNLKFDTIPSLYQERLRNTVINGFSKNILAKYDLKSTGKIRDSLSAHMSSEFGSMADYFKSKMIKDTKRFKTQFDLIGGIIKNPLILHEAKADYSMVKGDSYELPETNSYYGNINITSSWSVAMVPFEMSFDNQTWNDISNNNFSNVSLHFDRDNYVENLKKKLKTSFDPEAYLKTSLKNPLEEMKAAAEARLKNELQSVSHDFGDGLKSNIQGLGDVKDLFTKDIQSVRQQLINPDYIKSVEEKQRLLTELLNRKNSGQHIDKGELTRLETEVNKIKGVNRLVEKIEEHKERWKATGLLTNMKQADFLKKKQLEAIAKDPAIIGKLAKQHLNLSGFQKLFLKINKLNIGQNTLSSSTLSVKHLMNKGINTEFLNNNKYLMLGTAKIKSVNSIIDQRFTNPLYANDGMAKMIQMGLGSTSSSHSHISVSSYNQTLNSFSTFTPLNSFRNTLVTTISNQVNIGDRGVFSFELSRSATQYNDVATSDSSLQNKSAVKRIVSGDDLTKNMAFALKYEDELEYVGLAYGIHINKTSNGYVNPGNSFLNSGGKELGFKIKKSFWKSKFQTSVRSDIREFNYGTDNNRKWRNFYTVLDARLRLKKGQSIGIRYMPNKMVRIEGGVKSTATSMERLSIEGNITQKIAGLFYRNSLSVSRQTNGYILNNEMVRNKSITVSSFQNVVLNNKLLYANINYDYANNGTQYVYFNSSLVTEAGLTYLLLKKINMSSSISYNSVSGWYKQMGIKQTMLNQLSDRFSLNTYIDLRKNISLYQPLLYGLFRADVSIRYLIKK